MAQRDMVPWQHQGTPLVSLDDIMGLTAHRNTLTEMDIRLLEALLRYNFLTAAQASRLWAAPLRTMDHRLKRLYQWGLVDRGPLPQSAQGGRQLVYALAQRGFAVLTRLEYPLAQDWTDDWQPKSETGSQRLSVMHELGRNEVCIAIAETAAAQGKPILDWEGSREAGQKFVANSAHHEWQRIYPDAVLMLSSMQPLFIEYERSGRDTKFQKKIRALRTYLVSGQWQTRYPREPWVVYAIPAGVGTQGVIGGSYGGMVAQAGMTGARNYLMLDEEAWTRGTWLATRSDGAVINFWDAITF
ncbi:MAG: hypothetical protein C7B46_19400 [Sulfobacillus benefaciens]|uniref:Uncharacterized protein n=1 Tax=Sulfobacillus benefaciens TaxID=453960 RepID=A0A2T2WZC8_9FIRM|nr:MAG: hypothetical protein C7B46_19400 [Sulfobacillus benefaciens]